MTASSMDELLERAQRQLDCLRGAAEQLSRISATVTCPGGHVTATVDGEGALTGLTLADSARGIDAAVLGDVVVATAARAAAQAFARRSALLTQFNDDLTGLTRAE